MREEAAHAVLCDFGAAFCYDRSDAAAGFWEAMEVRAFGLFMQGLLQQHDVGDSSSADSREGVVQQLHVLVDRCLAEAPADRPSFSVLQQQLEGLQQ
jgi:hypothetical protein